MEAFKYLGSTLTKDGKCTSEIRIRIAVATSAMAGLRQTWRRREIGFITKIRLYRTLVLSTFLYGCESWSLSAEMEKRIQAFEMKCYRQLLGISWKEHKTNEYVRGQIISLAGPQEPLLATVKRQKLQWFGHVSRHNTLAKTILQGTLDGGRRRGRPRRTWTDDIKIWTSRSMASLLSEVNDRERWKRTTLSESLMSPQRPQRSRD